MFQSRPAFWCSMLASPLWPMPVKTTSRLSATPSPLVSVHLTMSSESVSLVRITPSWSGRIMRGATSLSTNTVCLS